MSALVVSFPKTPQYRRNRLAYVPGATVISLAQHLPPVERAEHFNCQADALVTLTSRLYFTAYLAAINAALCIAGLHHDSHCGDTQCANPAGKNPEDFREPA